MIYHRFLGQDKLFLIYNFYRIYDRYHAEQCFVLIKKKKIYIQNYIARYERIYDAYV